MTCLNVLFLPFILFGFEKPCECEVGLLPRNHLHRTPPPPHPDYNPPPFTRVSIFFYSHIFALIVSLYHDPRQTSSNHVDGRRRSPSSLSAISSCTEDGMGEAYTRLVEDHCMCNKEHQSFECKAPIISQNITLPKRRISKMTVSKSTFNVPTVDVSPYLADPTSIEALKIVKQVREACVTTGFFQLIGHGVPRSLQDEVFAGSEAFFKLPFEEKEKLDKSQSVGASNRGYELIGNQGLQEGTLPDLKEASSSYCLKLND